MIIHVGKLGGLPPGARIVLFLGNRGCDHLRELIRIAEFKGRAAYRIERAEELQPRWFAGVPEVGVVLGASELEPLLRQVLVRLRYFGRLAAQGMLEGVGR